MLTSGVDAYVGPNITQSPKINSPAKCDPLTLDISVSPVGINNLLALFIFFQISGGGVIFCTILNLVYINIYSIYIVIYVKMAYRAAFLTQVGKDIVTMAMLWKGAHTIKYGLFVKNIGHCCHIWPRLKSY